MIGATVYELPHGESVCPYHYHYGNEEWLVVLDGTPVVRTDDATSSCGPEMRSAFARGREGRTR